MDRMGFLQNIQKALQDLLAAQQRAALMQILRQQAGTMTFEDLRQFLSSPLGKGFASTRLSEVFGGPTIEPKTSPPASPEAATVTKSGRKRNAAKRRRNAGGTDQKKAPGRTKRRAKAKRATKKVRAKVDSNHGPRAPANTEGAATPSVEKRSPPGVSPAKRAEMDRYELAVLTAVREAGDWVAASDVRPRVGGNAESLRLAFKRLTERKAIMRQGERSQTRYKIAD